MTQPTAPASSPKCILAEHLADKDRYCRAAEAGELLFGADPLAVVRCVLFAAGMPAPRVTEPGPFVSALVKMGWQVIVPALGGPEPGDVFVVTDDARAPVSLGFVSKPSTDGAWFMKPDRERQTTTAVDFFLRLPTNVP